ncbi:MAG: hypothetical protein AAFR96_09355 [Planctomycetota bacterium]
MIELKTETDGFRQNAAVAERNRSKAMVQTVQPQAAVVVRHIQDYGPRTTNRLIASYAEAGNEAGIGRFVVPPIVPDPDEEEHRAVLLRQLQIAQQSFAFLDWQITAAQRYDASRGYDQRRRTGRKKKARRMSQPYYKKIRQQRNWWRRRLEAAERAWVDFNQAEGTAIVVNALAAFREVGIGTATTHVTKRAITVRKKVYGGSGKTVATGDMAFVHFVSHEPHVKLVQRNTRFMSDALKQIEEPRVRRVSKRTFVRSVGEGTAWTQAA